LLTDSLKATWRCSSFKEFRWSLLMNDKLENMRSTSTLLTLQLPPTIVSATIASLPFLGRSAGPQRWCPPDPTACGQLRQALEPLLHWLHHMLLRMRGAGAAFA
jgi:hypothetical protein